MSDKLQREISQLFQRIFLTADAINTFGNIDSNAMLTPLTEPAEWALWLTEY